MTTANDNNREGVDPIKSIEQVKGHKFAAGRMNGTVVTLINGAVLKYQPPLSKKEARRQALQQVAWHGLHQLAR